MRCASAAIHGSPESTLECAPAFSVTTSIAIPRRGFYDSIFTRTVSTHCAIRVVDSTDKATLQGFVKRHASDGAKVYTDDTSAYRSLDNHEAVKHSVGEYVNGLAHTNGVESFWSMLKRAHKGTFHNLSRKHLQRYVNEFAGRQNIRDMDTIDQMGHIVARLIGKRLMYRELIA